jgi:hypothetical protein
VLVFEPNHFRSLGIDRLNATSSQSSTAVAPRRVVPPLNRVGVVKTPSWIIRTRPADLNRVAVESIDLATDGERDGLADAGANRVLDSGRIGDVADQRALGVLFQSSASSAVPSPGVPAPPLSAKSPSTTGPSSVSIASRTASDIGTISV